MPLREVRDVKHFRADALLNGSSRQCVCTLFIVQYDDSRHDVGNHR